MRHKKLATGSIDGADNPDLCTGIASLATPKATGLVGNVEIKARTVTLLSGGAISIEASQTLHQHQLTKPIATRIDISADHLHLDGAARITAESTGNVPASAIEIHAADLLMDRGSRITTTSTEASGGNIQVTAQSMLRLRDSTITATVNGGPGTAGGNITIDPAFVILESSQIVSDAFQGRGGDITIEAGVLLADPTSQVSAKAQDSTVGIDGEINIRAPVTNLSNLVIPLPPDFASAVLLSHDRCAAQLQEGTVSSFVARGRASVPATPEDLSPSRLYPLSQMAAARSEWPLGKTIAPQQDILTVDASEGLQIIHGSFPVYTPAALTCKWTKP